MKLAIFLLPLTLLAQPWSGILDPSRAEDWSAGQVGFTIPTTRTQCGSTVAAYGTSGSPSSASTINTAIASCAANHYVLLGVGTFYLNTEINFNGHNNVTLRGSGPTQTTIVFSSVPGGDCGGNGANICVAPSTLYYIGSTQILPGGTLACNWTAGFTQGATNITLTGCGSSPTAGTILTLDQANDAPTNGYAGDTGGVFNCDYFNASSNSCQNQGAGNANGRTISATPVWSGSTHYVSANYSQQQVVTVVSYNAGTGAAVISPGLYGNNWRSAQTPGAWFPPHSVGMGVENLTLNYAASTSEDSGIMLNTCNQCWVQNVNSQSGLRNHVWIYQSYQCVVRQNYFYKTQQEGSGAYGVEFFSTSDDLVEDNIFQQVAGPMIFDQGSGVVLSYNFSINNAYTTSNNWNQTSYASHNAGTGFNLWEGNNLNSIVSDDLWGTSDLTTIFRNWLPGRAYNNTTLTSLNTIPISLYAGSRVTNVIGNVLGTPAYHAHYEAFAPSTGAATCDTTIYQLSWSDSECLLTAPVPNDTLVRSSLMRWGNYDVVNAAVRWDATESSPGAITYVNAQTTPGSHTLPSSMYLTSKPVWFGSVAFPATGPDVTGGSGPAGLAYTNPAQNCYTSVMGGPSNGTGSALAFDANTCYAGASGTGGTSSTNASSKNTVKNEDHE